MLRVSDQMIHARLRSSRIVSVRYKANMKTCRSESIADDADSDGAMLKINV